MAQDTGASADAETGSREPSPSSTGLGPAGFDPARMKRSSVAVFTHPGQVIKMTLPDGFRFVALTHGASPQAFPLYEQGVWEIDIPAILAKGRYPVAVAVIDAAHVRAWEALSIDKVDALLDGVVSPVSAIRGPSTIARKIP